MKKKLLIVASLVVAPLAGVAVTLEDTVKEVLNTNPIIQERVNYFRSVKQDVGIAEAGYYPKLDLVGGIGRERSINTSTAFTEKTLDKSEAGVVLTQNLFAGFTTENDVNKQMNRVDSAAYSVLEQANQVSLSMVQAYSNLFKQKELLALAQKNVETHKEINKKIQDRIDSGVGANSEVEQSSSRLALAESNLLAQTSNYDDALSTFTKVYGGYIDPADLDEPTTVTDLPSSKVMAVLASKKMNPSLKVQSANMKVAKSNYKLADRDTQPRVDLELRQDWNRNIGGVEGQNDSASAMLKFRWTLYNGGADRANQQKFISELHQEIQVFDNLNRRVDESISLAWTAYTILEKQMGYIKEHKALSEKTLASYLEEFNLGRRTILDILDTEEELYSANRELATAKYDYIFAQYRILESIGTLSSHVDANFADIVGLGEVKNSKAEVKDVMPTDKK